MHLTLNDSIHLLSNLSFCKDYVATRWYRAPELCGSFYSNVSSGSVSIVICIY